MAKCTYCGEDAGMLRKHHPKCKRKYEEGQQRIEQLTVSAIRNGSDLVWLEEQVEVVSQLSRVPIKESLVAAWEEAVGLFLDDDIISQEEEDHLSSFADHFRLSQEDLNINGAYTFVVRNAVLRDVLEGKVPDRVKIDGQLPFNFQKSEALVWAFPDTRYLELRTKRTYAGGYHGASVKVAKGLYYRVGAFRGHPVDSTEMIEMGTGLFGRNHQASLLRR